MSKKKMQDSCDNPLNTNQAEVDSESDSEDSFLSNYQRKVLLTTVILEKNTKLATICFMLVVVLERAAYYSLVANLAYFLLAYLNYNNLQSVIMVQIFFGMTWIFCIIGGVLGDFILGRFRTIVVGLLIYIVGFGMLPIIKYVANPKDDIINKGNSPWFIVWIFFSLFIISFAEGCFKSNMSPFGADQLTDTEDVELKTFFNYYYWAINIGALVGFVPMTYLQQKLGFIIGYSVSVFLLVVSLIVFYITQEKNYNLVIPSHGKLLKKLIQICCYARRKSEASQSSYVPIQHWLDRAKVMHGGKYSDADIEDIKKLFSVLPTLFFITLYCTGYYQVSSLYLVQGIHMNVNFGSRPIPAAWLSILNIITVLIFVPLIDKYLHSYLLKQQVYQHYVFRMSIGMILGALSLYAAGTIEYYRVNNKNIVVNTFDLSKNTKVIAANMTILYQVPQYVLMGLSEIFVIISGLQYAYCESPKSMQSFVTSLFFLVNGLGTFLSTIFILVGNALKLEVLIASNQFLSDSNLEEYENRI